MWRKEIEIILARQLASYLAMPIFIVDTDGNLLYFNEPAEGILGRRFEETGWMDSVKWSSVFRPIDENDQPIQPEDLPLQQTLNSRMPAHRRMRISGLDGTARWIEVMAFPLTGPGERFLGAVSLFWEQNGEQSE